MSIDGIFGPPPPPPPPAAPQWSLSGTFNGKTVVVGANARFGAAIYTIKVNGQEFLDSTDHGRELQSAWQYNNTGETQNPTEAGSLADGAGPYSTSRILFASVSGNTLTTRTQPAYWYPFSGQTVSPDFLDKTVTLGFNGRNNILVHNYGLYVGNPYNGFIATEGLTAYTPTAFTRMFAVDRATNAPTEIAPPYVWTQSTTHYGIAATADLSKAIALVHQNPPIGKHPQFWYWYGKAGNLWPKLDAAYWQEDNPSGWYRWRVFTVFGTMQEVIDSASTI
jgi:hypothetical protein